MKLGLDTNVLIYAHVPAFPESDRVRGFLTRAIQDAGSTLVITPLVLHEFIHIITDHRRFAPPVTMAEALATAAEYLGRSNVDCLAVDEAAMGLALRLLEAKQLGRKRIADTLLAATLLSHDVERLVTCNVADFAIFDDLEVVDPRVA